MRRKYITFSIIIIAFISMAILISEYIRSSSESKIVLIITKAQQDTSSLNPSRMIVASEMAINDYKLRSPSTTIINHFITYEGSEQEGYSLAKDFLEENPNVVAILGDFNSNGTALVAMLAEEYQIPHLSFFAIDETIFKDKPWSFSYRSQFKQEQKIMQEILQNYLGSTNIVAVVTNTSNIAQRWEQLEQYLNATNVDIHSTKTFVSSEWDFREYIESLKEIEDEFDTIAVFLSSSQVEHFLQQLYIMELRKPVVITGIILSVEGITELKGINLPLYSFVPEVYLKIDAEDDGEFQSFVKRYRVAMGYHRFDTLGPWIYDGMSLLYRLIDQFEDKEDIKKALADYDEIRMVGPVSFDENGLLKDGTFRIVTIRDGVFEEVINRETIR